MLVARLAFAGKNELGHSVFGHGASYGLHFFTTTLVPWPGLESISNSSIRRRTPGSPRPRLPEVEKPSRKARSEEHTSELQSRLHLVCRLLLEKRITYHPT